MSLPSPGTPVGRQNDTLCPGLQNFKQELEDKNKVIEQENSHTPPGGIKYAFEWK
jgi:hypothetical protein